MSRISHHYLAYISKMATNAIRLPGFQSSCEHVHVKETKKNSVIKAKSYKSAGKRKTLHVPMKLHSCMRFQSLL